MKKIITILLLTFVTTSVFAQVPEGIMKRTGRGLEINGCLLSETEVFNLIGKETYTETYQGAMKQYRYGGMFYGAGAGLMIGGGVCSLVGLALHQTDVGEYLFVYGLGCAGAGFVLATFGAPFYYVGKSRLNWIAEDYNDKHVAKEDNVQLSFGLAPHGVGLTMRF